MTISVLEIKAIARSIAESGALKQFVLPVPAIESGGLQVLLVEDDEADAYLIRRALAANPMVSDIVLAENGEEALELLDKRRVFPDLALIDLRMPRKDGIALLKDIAGRPTMLFPCAVLTSSKSGRDALRARHRGAVAFVTKPKAEPELKTALDRLVAGACMFGTDEVRRGATALREGSRPVEAAHPRRRAARPPAASAKPQA
jgi:CheY-like chemotaxis protein